jgi:hypothetical protein
MRLKNDDVSGVQNPELRWNKRNNSLSKSGREKEKKFQVFTTDNNLTPEMRWHKKNSSLYRGGAGDLDDYKDDYAK